MIAAISMSAALALLGSATAASTAGTSTQPILSGPVISGVCVISIEAVMSGSKVGQAATVRFQQLTQAAQNEMLGERTSLETEAKAVDAEGKKLPAAQLAQRREALNTRMKTLQDRATLRSRELEYTRQDVVQRISQQAQPVINSVYASHNCGLLFRREGVLGGNPTNDLTVEVVRGLDAKLTTLTFDRETLPVSGAPEKPAA